MKALKAYAVVFPELLFLFLLLILTHNTLTNDFSILHNVNLIFHEAGHTIFSILGEYISVLGGSAMQLLVPIIVLIVFLREGRWYGVMFGIWWLGENFVDISFYAADAKLRELSLLGGDAVIHDWWYILTKMRILEHAELIGMLFWWAGAIIMATSIAILLGFIHEKLPQNTVH